MTNQPLKPVVEARKALENDRQGAVCCHFEVKFDPVLMRVGRSDMVQRDGSGPALLLTASTGSRAHVECPRFRVEPARARKRCGGLIP